jgi:hypothetical protein
MQSYNSTLAKHQKLRKIITSEAILSVSIPDRPGPKKNTGLNFELPTDIRTVGREI